MNSFIAYLTTALTTTYCNDINHKGLTKNGEREI